MMNFFGEKNTKVAGMRFGFYIALLGIYSVVILILFLLFFGIRTSSDIVAIVGVLTTMIGSLVGAFLGIEVGSEDKTNVQNERNKAERKINYMMGQFDPSVAESILEKFESEEK